MSHRGYRNYTSDKELARFQLPDRTPDTRSGQKGVCGCGTETTRYKTVGPPGHHGNGWQCEQCGIAEFTAAEELRVPFEMAKHDPRLI